MFSEYSLLLVLIFTIRSSGAENADLLIIPLDEIVNKPIGDSIVFTCKVQYMEHGADPELRWFGANGDQIREQSGRKYVESDGADVLKLYNTNIQKDDAGLYNCRGRLNGNDITKQIQLQIFQDIVFENVPALQHPVIDTDALIICEVKGQPIPTISWRRDGQKITQSDRYSYDPKGLTIKSITEEDNGAYLCRAEVLQAGRLKEMSINVVVHIPPQITQEIGDNENIEGRETTIECKAAIGLPAAQYEFYKGNIAAPVQASPRIIVNRQDGALTFQPLQKEDEDQYTCKAINDAGEARSSGFLKVLVPPHIIELKNVTSEEKTTVTLTCLSKGDPIPKMTFRKVGSDKPYNSGINEGTHIQIDESDNEIKMTIKDLTPKDSANYTCETKNVAGTFKRNGQIRVHYSPRFKEDHVRSVYTWTGKRRNITCEALGEPIPNIDFYHHKARIDYNNETFVVTRYGRHADLQIKVKDNDLNWIYGNYTCRATNIYGSNDLKIQLTQARVPGKPRNITVCDSSPTMVVFNVLPPEDDGGVKVDSYRIEHLNSINDFLIGGGEMTCDGQELRLENLQSSTAYIFYIRAKNEVGAGAYTEYSFKTPGLRKPYPINIIANKEGTKPYSFAVKWDKPKTGGLPITSYHIHYRKVQITDSWEVDKPLEEWTIQTIEDQPREPLLYYNIKRLSPNSYYEVKVIAESDMGNSDDPEAQFVFHTEEGEEIAPVVNYSSLSTGGIIGVVIAVFIIFLIIVDISCYFLNDCGILMCICVHMCGKTQPTSKERMMEDGDSKPVIREQPLIEETKAPPLESYPQIVEKDGYLIKTGGTVNAAADSIPTDLDDEDETVGSDKQLLDDAEDTIIEDNIMKDIVIPADNLVECSERLKDDEIESELEEKFEPNFKDEPMDDEINEYTPLTEEVKKTTEQSLLDEPFANEPLVDKPLIGMDMDIDMDIEKPNDVFETIESNYVEDSPEKKLIEDDPISYEKPDIPQVIIETSPTDLLGDILDEEASLV